MIEIFEDDKDLTEEELYTQELLNEEVNNAMDVRKRLENRLDERRLKKELEDDFEDFDF